MQFNVLTGFTFLNNQTCYNEIFIFINKRSNNFLSMCFFWAFNFLGLSCKLAVVKITVRDWPFVPGCGWLVQLNVTTKQNFKCNKCHQLP